jgi:hypothetical protein
MHALLWLVIIAAACVPWVIGTLLTVEPDPEEEDDHDGTDATEPNKVDVGTDTGVWLRRGNRILKMRG